MIDIIYLSVGQCTKSAGDQILFSLTVCHPVVTKIMLSLISFSWWNSLRTSTITDPYQPQCKTDEYSWVVVMERISIDPMDFLLQCTQGFHLTLTPIWNMSPVSISAEERERKWRDGERKEQPPLFICLMSLPRSVIKQGCTFHWPSLGDFIPYSQMLLSPEHCPLPKSKAGNSTKYPSNILCLQCWTFS